MESNATRASEKTQRARQLAARIANMTEAERQALAAKLPAVVTAEGRPLTLHNSIFLAMQSGRSDLVQVGGFRQWVRAANRVVRKGEHAVGFIFVPLTGRREESADDSEGEKRPIRFRLVPVFSIEQTQEIGGAS
jgi:hypothetical protein